MQTSGRDTEPPATPTGLLTDQTIERARLKMDAAIVAAIEQARMSIDYDIALDLALTLEDARLRRGEGRKNQNVFTS